MGHYQLSRPPATSANATALLSAGPSDNRHVVELVYRNHIPGFVDATLIRLYDNVYCTLRRIGAFESLEGISTYVRWIDSVIHTVILFRDHGKGILALNQQIALKKDDIEHFAKKIFEDYGRAQTISFYALDLDPCRLAYPFQHLAALEENVIFFPPRAEDYLKSFKGQFRKQLRVGHEQMLADHPGYHLKHYSKKEIRREFVTAILGIAERRMSKKGQANYTRELDVDVLTGMLHACGHMTVAYVDDRICAGAMWFSVGKRHFHQIAAHDPAYDRYMLGNQVWLAAILHSLHLGGSECWLMGGSGAHKGRFGARTKILNSFIVYRSTWHICLNLGKYLAIWAKHTGCRCKLVLKELSTRSTLTGKVAGKIRLIAGSRNR